MKTSHLWFFAAFLLPAFLPFNDNYSVIQISQDDSLSTKCEAYYLANKGNSLPSKSLGTTSKGSLVNGKLVPWKGKNYRYFDAGSYLMGRAYVHNKVRDALLESYRLLDSMVPSRTFYIMECSNRNGGYFFPHQTHQNGLSVDLMMPMLKAGKPYTGLDTLGIPHYWLEFDNKGRYSKDTSISINFELVATQILALDKAARMHHLRIAKVIVKIELKDELFSGRYGKLLKGSGIYIVKSLTPSVNAQHDDHFHVDFGP